METVGLIDVGDKRQSVRLLTQHLEKAFEKRARMGRMDALDIESLPDETEEASASITLTATTIEAETHCNQNHVTSLSRPERLSKSTTELNNNSTSFTEDEIVTHKPPKYPSLPVALKAQGKVVVGRNSDDPFSADFEDAIGDNIEEDTELEWDHSPDMDINGDLSMSVLGGIPGDVDNELDDLPLPPPPLDLLGVNSVNVDEDPNDEPLPPPPPDIEDANTNFQVINCEINSTTCSEEASRHDGVGFGFSPSFIQNVDNYQCSVKETAIDADLSAQSDAIGFSANMEKSETDVVISGETEIAEPNLTNFENVVVCETPVINNPTGNVAIEPQTQTSLDTSVSSNDGSGTHADTEDSFACDTSATIVRPKSQSLKNRRPYYVNIAESKESNSLSLDTKMATSVHYDQMVGSIPNGQIRLDQTPPPHSLYFKLPMRPAHHYEEIESDHGPNSTVHFESKKDHLGTMAETMRKSPPSAGSGKKVLFQLPVSGSSNTDMDEIVQDEHVGRHSFHGLMHSKSSDAVLRSPPARVKLPEPRSKSPSLERKRKEIYRHSTPAVLHKVQPPVVTNALNNGLHPANKVSSAMKNKVSGGQRPQQAGANHTLAGGRLLNKLKRSEVKKDQSGSGALRHVDSTVQGSAESDDSYFTDSDFDDDYNDVYNIDEDGLSSTSDFTSYSDETAPRSPQGGSPDMDTCYDVMLELLKTEKAYVDRLHFLCRVVLLNVKVLNNVQDIHVIPPDAVTKIFSNIERIFSLHTSTVLPLLEERLNNWKFCPRVDDIMKEVLPHLALYREFVENFSIAMAAMTVWMEKCPIFQKLIQEVEKTPECRRMKVKQHFLEVVQRVPRYYDLLKSYSSHVVERSPEKDSIKDVLSLLDELVTELEREMGKTDRMKTLRSVQQRLDSSAINIVSPLRELIKEGKIRSICAKTGKKLDRMIFLMDDMLLICTCPGLGSKFKLKFTLPVDKMQVHDSDNLVIPFTFYVQSKTRAIEFHCLSLEDKLCWVSTMQAVVDEFTKKKLLSQPVSVIQKTIPEEDIGRVAPRAESPQGQPLCYICKAGLKKVNNCKGCGMLVCQKCSSHKIKLDFEKMKWTRVCDECFVLVSNRDLLQSTATWDVPNVGPSDPCNIAGYLQLSFNKGHCWHKRWITLHSHGVLYSFKNFKDHQVVGSLTLKRFSFAHTSKADEVHKATTFKVYNARRTYFFQADNADAVCKWMDALTDLCDSKT